MASFEGQEPFPHDRQQYFDLVFGFAAPPSRSVNGYFDEISNRRFSWLPVLTDVGPPHGVIELSLPAGDCLGDCPGRPGGPCFIDRFGCVNDEGDRRYYANIISRAMALEVVDYQPRCD